MSKLPPEVEKYYSDGIRTAISVIANDDFTITITFDNGKVKLYDMKETLNGNAFKSIRDLKRFKTVYIDDSGSIAWDKDPSVDSNIVWNNHLDISTDSCYIYGTSLN